ncbi:anthranilate synthase component I [Stella humosa]|uniref:Anthranilate synthase n=1 Tax=Stella humosa TaxID=94 RepID=A0A3N1KI96_9PROT|nr:anthranilate synthase component I [Stella humosa]ROP81283.1 anthranilate synthase component I [Stella humosa]BBK32632.1 anthranilate synthase component I [Stella humosa]
MKWNLTDQANAFDYRTRGGLDVRRDSRPVDGDAALAQLATALDGRRGALFSSGVEYPGRYSRYDFGFVDPPLALETVGRTVRLSVLNPRGRLLLDFAASALPADLFQVQERTPDHLAGEVVGDAAVAYEEQRTRRPSVFSVLRHLVDAFGSAEDGHLGLYGAFGYDLVFQFEELQRRRPREADQRDIVLYLPDRLVLVDRRTERAAELSYDFALDGRSTAGIARTPVAAAYRIEPHQPSADHESGAYPALVERAREHFARGDLFEAVPGQLFREPCAATPAEVYATLCRINPAPYAALVNLGEGEFLVSASPEMFVRSDGARVETCPISGTIARGRDPIGDAEQIRLLLNSAKDEYELNMCTDVDRNDKARVCVPGSVKVLGRRQIELYSKLIHTVDHVEGMLRPGYDALDAFLSHAWAVTVTGAPKLWAMQFCEDHERTPRRWYGGAIGCVTFDGAMNTGLTIRTIRMKDGLAEIRVGATLLWDSDPEAEDAECRIKAAALFQAIRETGKSAAPAPAPLSRAGVGKRLLLVDHDDSFVHTLADFFRQTGAEVAVVRHGRALAALAEDAPDLLVLSPGPGRPADFAVDRIIDAAMAAGVPIFGVCLGLQALGERFGGSLAQLDTPAHGRPSRIALQGGRLFAGLPDEVVVGRYHSLYVDPARLPANFRVTALSADGVPMALEHDTLPLAGVQFHPESIMSLGDRAGHRIVANAVGMAR